MANPKLKISTPRGTIIQTATKNGKVRAELKWNEGFGSEWTSRFETAQKFVDSEVLRYCDPLVPFQTGMLKLSGKLGTVIGSGEVRYIAPYAKKMYYGTHFKFNDAPTRGAYWFERMKITRKESILKGAARIAGRK